MRHASEWVKEVASGQYDRTYWDQVFEAEDPQIQEESDRAVHAMIARRAVHPAGASRNRELSSA